jgi:PBSX family phage terminase large subunit
MADVSKIICPAFYDLFNKIEDNKYTHYWLKGGRGSTKSSFISIEIVLGIIRHENTHAVCFRKIGTDLRDSVFNQILWAIDILGVSAYFEAKVAPMEITYKPTGQKIIFRGLDDPRKAKSAKMPRGYFRYIWFEELEQYAGMQEIRSVLQSYMRGGNVFTCFYSYNPPQTVSNWVNIEATLPVDNRYVHTSNYLDVPPEWLGQEFIIEAELLKKNNELAYKHEYLGEVTGTGGAVFTNLVQKEITDQEIAQMPKFDYGIDWGFAVDPFAWGKLYYDKTRRDLYILDEIYKVGMLNDEAFSKIKEKGVGTDLIVADSAEPKSVSEGQRYGLNIRGAEKGKDSVRFGIKWLQRLSHIYIDPKRTPNAWREFSTYEFERNKAGEFISDYPDKDNHYIDMTRYAMEKYMKQRGLF